MDIKNNLSSKSIGKILGLDVATVREYWSLGQDLKVEKKRFATFLRILPLDKCAPYWLLFTKEYYALSSSYSKVLRERAIFRLQLQQTERRICISSSQKS
jgi:hypothetical protein